MKKGDRVKVYGNLGTQGTLLKRNMDYFTDGSKATIIDRSSHPEIWITFDKKESCISGVTALVHVKQCRKLRKKA